MTDITLADLFGISKPLIQAPMAGAQDHRLAIAVSKAGGLGSLPCAMLDAETIRSQVAQFREATGNPVNLNFFCHSLPAHDPEREQAWMARLAPYFDEFGIDSPEPGQGGSRQPFSQAFAEVVASLAPEVVSFHFGLPDDALIARVRRSGARIIASATTIEEALWLEEKGVDAIIAQGIEAGGHRGNFLSMDVTQQMGTLALVPQIAHRVDVPVIAAGGIASPEGIAAAMALGAAGVQVGTAYLLCDESTISPLHRQALQSPGHEHTAITNVFTGRPARGIVNRLMRETGPMRDDVPAFPLAAPVLGELRTRAERAGSSDFSPLWAGQNTSACRETSAKDLTNWLIPS